MKTYDLARVMAELDFSLWVTGDTLRYRAPGRMQKQINSLLRKNKPEILKLFAAQNQRFLVLGARCDCGNKLFIPRAYKWLDFDKTDRFGFQCTGCGTRYRFV